MPHGPMKVDDFILSALEGGPVTVNDITKRFEARVRMRLDKLRVRGVVLREGRGGAHREFTYRLLRPDLAAKALREKGGLAGPQKQRQETQTKASCWVEAHVGSGSGFEFSGEALGLRPPRVAVLAQFGYHFPQVPKLSLSGGKAAFRGVRGKHLAFGPIK